MTPTPPTTPAEALRACITAFNAYGPSSSGPLRRAAAKAEAALPIAQAQEEAVKALQAFMPELDERERFIEYQDAPHTDEQRAMLRRISNARAALALASPHTPAEPKES